MNIYLIYHSINRIDIFESSIISLYLDNISHNQTLNYFRFWLFFSFQPLTYLGLYVSREQDLLDSHLYNLHCTYTSLIYNCVISWICNSIDPVSNLKIIKKSYWLILVTYHCHIIRMDHKNYFYKVLPSSMTSFGLFELRSLVLLYSR